MAKIKYGINLNPQHPFCRPQNAADLDGLQWVRLVFQRAAASYPDLATAFNFYDPLIQTYAQAGVRSLLILNQETYWGQGPWNTGDWQLYADGFADQARQIAAHYSGQNVAYQIWNEGDIRGPSSVYVEASDFAPVLEKAAAAIRAKDPNAEIVFGGLASGTEPAIQYVQAVRAALGGNLPVDAIGVHPYGMWPPSGRPSIPTGWFAPLEPALRRYTNAFAGTPIWITEVGVSEPGGIGSDHWSKIADYLEETLTLIQQYYASAVPVVMWFAWSDVMRGAGIVNASGNPKQPIYDRFFGIVRAPVAGEPVALTPARTDLTPTVQSLRVRRGPGTNHGIITRVNPGDRLGVEESWETACAKLGQRGEWINVRPPGHDPGWSAAWYLKLLVETPSHAPPLLTPTDNGLRVRGGPGLQSAIRDHADTGDLLEALEEWSGAVAKLGQPGRWINVRTPDGIEGWAAAWFLRLPTPQEMHGYPGPPPPSEPTTTADADLLRALAFERDISFDRLPVCDPATVDSFSGFGPNNFSYYTFVRGDDYYRNLRGLHNGLDFLMAVGTPLCSIDWGVVVHVSNREGDNPYGAGPFSVIIRHGRHVALYGHMMGMRQGEHMFVQEGDIVAPGQTIGLSGTSNNCPHLHFEMRKISQAYVNQLRRDAEASTPDPLRQLEHMQESFHLRGWEPTQTYYINPAPFFEPSLETYWQTHNWRHPCMVIEDTNDNGYPDQVILAGEQVPKDHDLNSCPFYGPRGPHFWAGSRTA
jgi:murein DD-endopeptidase MepM/ murein hydrolase activator NlpD